MQEPLENGTVELGYHTTFQEGSQFGKAHLAFEISSGR